MKNLPLGINTLSAMISNNMVYVDKTEMAWNLVKLPGRYFLSRPRRFGKSLFVDTLKEIFEGNQALFEGLYIHDQWDWNKSYPVIKIDFASGNVRSRDELDGRIGEVLQENMKRFEVFSDKKSISGIFSDLIGNVAEKYGQRVVVLVDEYDKPILDNIDEPDAAAEVREGLKNLYSVLKGQDANLQFVFLTGVSKFSKVSLFSGVNQLTDLTIDAKYSTLCGYTEADLHHSFGEFLEEVDWAELRLWYNGYGWTGRERVYNPFDILQFIAKGLEYRSYWFETGSPSFLLKLFQKNQYFLPELEDVEVSEEILDSFDVERINPLTLLFQTGYLTIVAKEQRIRRQIFKLCIPNFEVKAALNDQFINAYTDLVNAKLGYQERIYDVLMKGDMDGLSAWIKRLFAAIPYRNFTNTNLADFEGYYASVLYAFFASLDAEIIPEDFSLYGQADMTVKLGDHIYVMEVKVVESDCVEGNPALKQIQARDYAAKYRGMEGKTVHEVGLVFSKEVRNLIQVDWAD